MDPVEGAGQSFKCLPCSSHHGGTRIIAKLSIPAHRKTRIHRFAIGALAGGASTAPVNLQSLDRADEPGFAVLSVADQFMISDSEDENESPPPVELNPFENVVQYDHEFFDSQGNPIVFEAGHAEQDNTRERLARELRALDYYDHEIFGKMSTATSCESHAEEHGGDSTIPNIIAMMQTRGEFEPFRILLSADCAEGLEDEDEDEDEAGEEYDSGMPENVRSDGDWAPHNSKTVRASSDSRFFRPPSMVPNDNLAIRCSC